MSQIEVPADILKMPVADRIELVGKIWDSIADDSFPPLSEDQKRILDERIAEHEANPNRGESWESVRRDLFGDE